MNVMDIKCFRGVPVKELAENIASEPLPRDTIQYIMNDLLTHTHSHSLIGKDYWAPKYSLNSMNNLIAHNNSLPEEVVDVIFHNGIHKAVFTYDKIKFSELFLEQENASIAIFFDSIRIITGLDVLEPKAWDDSVRRDKRLLYSDELKLITKIFALTTFPTELLLGFCGSGSRDIRRIASNTHSCPREGKVIAALMGS